MPAIRSLFLGTAGIKGLVLSSSLHEPPQKGSAVAVLCLSEKPQKALKLTLFLERAKPALPYGGVLASRRLCRPHVRFHSENASFPISFHDAKTGFLTV